MFRCAQAYFVDATLHGAPLRLKGEDASDGSGGRVAWWGAGSRKVVVARILEVPFRGSLCLRSSAREQFEQAGLGGVRWESVPDGGEGWHRMWVEELPGLLDELRTEPGALDLEPGDLGRPPIVEPPSPVRGYVLGAAGPPMHLFCLAGRPWSPIFVTDEAAEALRRLRLNGLKLRHVGPVGRTREGACQPLPPEVDRPFSASVVEDLLGAFGADGRLRHLDLDVVVPEAVIAEIARLGPALVANANQQPFGVARAYIVCDQLRREAGWRWRGVPDPRSPGHVTSAVVSPDRSRCLLPWGIYKSLEDPAELAALPGWFADVVEGRRWTGTPGEMVLVWPPLAAR
jgi:hypothetical protein